MQLPVRYVANRAACPSNRQVEASCGKPASRSISEPDSASLCSLVESGYALRLAEACHRRGSNGCEHTPGSPGWLGAARGERPVEEPGRPVGVGVIAQRGAGMHNPAYRGTPSGVGEAHSSDETANHRGAKGPYCGHVESDGAEGRLARRHAHYGGSEQSPKPLHQRQKLCRRAKHDSGLAFRAYASGESSQESRMREILTSGSRRGRGHQPLSTLPKLCNSCRLLIRNRRQIQ